MSVDDDGRVPFGPGETDTVPAAWAAGMLTWIKTSHPQVFIDALAQALEIEHKPRGRRAGHTAAPLTDPPGITIPNGSHARTG